MPQTADYVLISGLQHLAFCPRQWALIHIAKKWEENFLTAGGQLMHRKAHSDECENRPGIHIARGLALKSERLRIIGIADIVEFHKTVKNGICVSGLEGRWEPFPVEYKHGCPKKNNCDKLQLCAQAVSLEEMLHCKISRGALFYGRIRRRQEVYFTPELRNELKEICCSAHAMLETGKIPEAHYSSFCKNCSLKDICLPKVTQSAQKYIELQLRRMGDEEK